jgi:hypothetical protein
LRRPKLLQAFARGAQIGTKLQRLSKICDRTLFVAKPQFGLARGFATTGSHA